MTVTFLLRTALHLFVLVFCFAMRNVAVCSLLGELPAAELALHTVIWSFVLHLLATVTASARLRLWSISDSLSELHGLQFPFWNLASRHLLLLLLLSSLSLLLSCLLLESHFLCIGIFINPLASSISSLPLVFSVEFFAFVDEDFLANFVMFLECLLVELAATRIALDQPSHIAVLIRLRLSVHSPTSS